MFSRFETKKKKKRENRSWPKRLIRNAASTLEKGKKNPDRLGGRGGGGEEEGEISIGRRLRERGGRRKFMPSRVKCK